LKKKNLNDKASTDQTIVIDPDKDLVFSTEEELFDHFALQILEIETFYFDVLKSYDDLKIENFNKYEKNLTLCLQNPDEVWFTDELTSIETAIYIKKIKDDLHHIAICYLYNDEPSFIFMHFPTTSVGLIEEFRMGEMVFDLTTKDVYPGAIDGDALSEGDILAIGHYKAMLVVRNDSDIPAADFQNYSPLREDSIELADEIWRTSDSYGQNIVTFIKHHPDPENIYYIVVTLEDSESDSNILLFSFPTNDEALVDRYRQGENLQADEIIQENSH
jgi:hypothetical protein